MWFVLPLACDLFPKPKEHPELPEPFSSCASEDGDPFEYGGLDSGDPSYLAIDGDTLTVTVSYGGGCEEHAWVVCWPDGAFMESEPVQARLELYQDILSDTVCDAYLSEDLDFDLRPLKDAWHESYGEGPGTIVIHMGEQSVDYTF